MALRATMLDLTEQLRLLIGDNGLIENFTDDQIQDRLDAHRTEMRYIELRPQPSFQPGGAVLYLDYYSDQQYWESDILIQNLSYYTVVPDLSEDIVGHWHFNTQPTGIGIRATGKIYDIYASGAELLESWAAQVKLDFAFVSGRDQYQRQQKFDMLLKLAASFRARAQVHTSRLIQSDATSDHDGTGIVYPVLGPTVGP